MKKIKNFVISCMLACSLVVISACSNHGNHKNTKIRLSEVTRSVFYAPQYVALAKNFFQEKNVEIQLTTAEGSDKVMTAILSSQADVGLTGTSSVISVIEQGCENYPIAFAELTERDGSFLIGRTNDFNWKNLIDKKIIAGRKGGIPEMVLEYVFKKHGFRPNENLKFINNIQFDLMSVAFGRGIGDYVALFEPVASRIISEKNFFNVLDIGTECDPLPYTCYCANKKYIQNNPEAIEKFTAAIYKAQKWIYAHSSQEIAREISKYFIDFDVESLSQCIDKYKNMGVWAKNPLIKQSEFDFLQEIMMSAGELKKPVEFNDSVDNSWGEKAMEKV